MRGLQQHLLWWAALALAILAGYVVLTPELAPKNWMETVGNASAVVAIYGLGVIGLVLLREDTLASGVGAVALSLFSLLGARTGRDELASIGFLDSALTAGLLLRLHRLRRGSERKPPLDDL